MYSTMEGGAAPRGPESLGGSEMEILGELVQFLRQEKKWWMIPVAVFLLILGAILAMAGNPVLAPLIYPLF